MTDKTRLEFEEAMKKEVGWGKETLLVIGDRYFYSEAQSAFESWLLAKEKYEPRWISVEKRMPETWGFKICYAPMNGIFIACLMNDGEFRVEHTDLRVGVTHWMEWPSIPSTQGEDQ